ADLLDAIGVSVRDQPVLVIGYGPVGEGVAAHLAALGADVRVAEVDPVRALIAAHDGFEVGEAATLARDALVVSATGVPHTVSTDIVSVARIVAVAGGVPGEVDLPATPGLRVAEHVDRFGNTLVLDEGGCINITAAEGNPIEIMDLSFAVQLAALAELVAQRPGIGIHRVSPAVDDRVARAALAVRGLRAVDAADSDTVEVADWRSPRYARPENTA
ncbi:MAG: hypothetical protein KKH75_00910, partial [Actinobacteria bacterium]|nr:hypothetical protein [Actinomycetota bacterium]